MSTGARLELFSLRGRVLKLVSDWLETLRRVDQTEPLGPPKVLPSTPSTLLVSFKLVIKKRKQHHELSRDGLLLWLYSSWALTKFNEEVLND